MYVVLYSIKTMDAFRQHMFLYCAVASAAVVYGGNPIEFYYPRK